MSCVDRRDAIRRDMQFESAHVCVVRREQHTDIGRDARHDQLLNLKIAEQNFERRRIEGGAMWLYYVLVVRFRLQQLNNLSAFSLASCEVFRHSLEIFLPFAKVIIDVDHWKPGAIRTAFEHGKLLCHRKRFPEKCVTVFEFEVGNDI